MHSFAPTCSWIIIGVTVAVSLWGFTNRDIEERCIFDPQRILAGKEYYRLFTSALLHADWRHLALNMLSFYFFGPALEVFLGYQRLLLIYLGSILGGNLLSLYLHRHHIYRAYGASGGVCGIIFAHILLWPGSGIGFFIIPVSIPGWLYAPLFIFGSFRAMKAGRDHIGHDAHLGGAIIGLLIAAGLEPQAVRYNPLVFFTVLIAAAALFVYLWVNPLMLHRTSSVPWRKRNRCLPRHKQEQLDIDRILEKVAAKGIESLDQNERNLLAEVSDKYRRREDSKKPESGLAI